MNPLNILAQHRLLSPIVQLCCPTIRMIGNILSSFKGSTFLKKAS